MPERESKTSTVPVVWATFGIFSARSKWLVTIDETWLYHYDPETKQQSMEWRHSGSPRPQKIPSAKIRWKSSRLVFWDQDVILLVAYLPKGQTINAVYYSSLQVQLKGILKEKHRGKFTKGASFLQDNAPAHRAFATRKKLACLGFHCLDHPRNSPDLAPSDYNLFPWLKKTIESSPFSFFVRRWDHSCHVDLVGRTTFWVFFEWLAKFRATG